MSKYTFIPVTQADLPLLRDWLSTPEVRQWWGDPKHEIGLIREDLESDKMVNLMVRYRDMTFAYAQHYDVHDWPQPHLEHLPSGSRSIDTFVGEPTMLGAGHASGYLRQLALDLTADGAAAVVIDPEVSNLRARRAFEKAGFTRSGFFGPEDKAGLVMHFEPQPS